MIAAANILTDLVLSLSALTGLFILSRSLRTADEWDPLNRRFLFGIRVTMLLFAGRALIVLTGGAGFRFVVLIAAALLPLAVLLLTEGLLRRHAPQAVKAFAAVGAVLFCLLAFVPAPLVDPWRLHGLLVFQVAGFALSGWLVLTRDRDGLSASENQMAGRLALSLIVLIPLIGADFLMVLIGLPVQLSALGVLVLCWLAIGLGRVQVGHRGPVRSLIVAVIAAVGLGFFLAFILPLGTGGGVIVTALIVAVILLLAILNDATSLRDEARNHRLLQHLAHGDATDAMTFLRGLQSHPLVEGAAVIGAQELSDFDAATLDAIFARTPVLRKQAPQVQDPAEQDHVNQLFHQFAATHILQVRSAPRLLVALAMPAMTTAPLAELELDAVQRMAWEIARRDPA
ncbi:hypothetical protein [Yoonia sp. 208BN28-4]|uniref:hypothetical protein n=1 Tax=Yoonia sp. 208BN28-4 TaxID=3126505 RepID=UPI00309DC34F